MHIYHILKKADRTEKIQLPYEADSLASQGFIHCCTAEQIPYVIENWFKGEHDLVIMEITPQLVTSKVVFENLEGGKELFPHIYGPINPDAIIKTQPFHEFIKSIPSNRQPIPVDQFVARSHFIFDQGWFLLVSGDFNKNHFNCMTISWGLLGTMWSLPVAMVAVRYSRHTYKFMDESNSFTLNAFAPQYMEVLNELGSQSGRDIDKMKYPRISPMASQSVLSPSYREAELVLECKKVYWEDMNPAHFLDDRIRGKYPNPDYHRFFIGEVTGLFGIEKYCR
jgi:uncharacterized protein (DUF952 family)/flavin reductase (DIM6/NTAB) family NADH-FMN oxidoreductase RutF